MGDDHVGARPGELGPSTSRRPVRPTPRRVDRLEMRAVDRRENAAEYGDAERATHLTSGVVDGRADASLGHGQGAHDRLRGGGHRESQTGGQDDHPPRDGGVGGSTGPPSRSAVGRLGSGAGCRRSGRGRAGPGPGWRRPYGDVEVALAGMERAATRGVRGRAIPTHVDPARPYCHPDYDPFWTAAQDFGVPITMQIITGFSLDGGLPAHWGTPAGTIKGYTLAHGTVVNTMIDLICGRSVRALSPLQVRDLSVRDGMGGAVPPTPRPRHAPHPDVRRRLPDDEAVGLLPPQLRPWGRCANQLHPQRTTIVESVFD